MISFKRLTGGILFGWGSTLVSVLAGIFMSPFLIHHLGEAGYGVWVLVQSSVAYMYLMDLGLRSTVVRFSVHAHARGDHAEVNRVVSAALWIRLLSAAVIMLLGGMLAFSLPHIFKLPPQYVLTARATALLAALTLSSTLVFSVYAAVLSSLGRFDLLGIFELAQVLTTSIGLVPVVLLHWGLIGMAAWQFAVVLTVNLLTVWSCYRQYPVLLVSLTVPQRDLLRSLWNFSAYVLLLNAAGQMILYADNLVVGAFISAAAVTYYAIAGKMVEYLRQCAIVVLKNYMPMASSFAAKEETGKLQQLHLHGTQAVLLVTYPIAAVLLTRGHTFFRLWIGPDFSARTTPILLVLLLAAVVMLASSTNNGICLAIGKQKPLALVTIAEGLCNLALSITLAKHYGVIGVALGTALPTTVTSLFFWPNYMCRQLQMSSLTFMLQAWLRPVLAILPFGLACYWVEQHFATPNFRVLLVQMLALLPMLAVGLLVVFYKEIPVAYKFIQSKTSS